MGFPWRLVLVFLLMAAMGQGQDRVVPVVGTSNNQIQVVNTYPEYWVDGRPFMEHSASFFYHRFPRDRWAQELIHLKALGINTIDVYPFWNWHQPEENVLDFDGHTNPRRDLHSLLQLIKDLGLKATLRPGPYYTSEWRNGGYPDWLLRRPEYHMSEQSILEGRYPRLSSLQYDKSEAAADGYLQNQTHLEYSRKWYQAVLGIAEPYFADKGGPIINIQIDDDQAIGRENYNGPQFWKYMDLLRDYAEDITHYSKLPYYINGADMRVNAESNYAPRQPFWNTGQDYQMSGEGGYSTTLEAAKNKFFTEIVKTQPLFPPGMIEFQAGWFVDEKDTYARPTDPSNTLMASRVMFQNGLKVLNYYPLNDTLYPAGYECQWANWFYGWETAINYIGQETGRAPYVRRNGRLLNGMGALLGAAHFLPDAALVYPMATFPQAELTSDEANFVANWSGRVLWSGVFDHFNFELIDSDNTPEENFQRYRVLMLPDMLNGEGETGKQFPHLTHYSEKAQRLLQEYVQAGGTLVVFPSLPKGEMFDRMFAPLGKDQSTSGDAPIQFSDGTNATVVEGHSAILVPENSANSVRVFARDAQGAVVGARFALGKGQVLFFGGDFSRWSVPPGTVLNFEQGGLQGTSKDYSEETQRSARAVLPALMKEAGVLRKVNAAVSPAQPREPGLYTTELVADEGILPFEKSADTKSGFGFVGVTNFSPDQSYTADLQVIDPRAADLGSGLNVLRLPHVSVPPRESVLLPVRLPLDHRFLELGQALAGDQIVYATVELTKVEYDSTTLRLDFTAPADGEVLFQLTRPPTSAKLDGHVVTVQGNPRHAFYLVKIARGEAPDYSRRLELSYRRSSPRIQIHAEGSWIAGDSREVQLRVLNPSAALRGTLNFEAGGVPVAERPIDVPAGKDASVALSVKVPADAPEGMPLELVAALRTKDPASTYTVRSQVTVHRRLSASVAVVPTIQFPLREDQPFAVIHPTLASVDLPGTIRIRVQVRNWQAQPQTVSLTASGDMSISLSPESFEMQLSPDQEKTLDLTATPMKGTGLYRFAVQLRSGTEKMTEEVVLAAVAKGEALAYAFDFDRDGYDDIILENQQVRMFVSPHAGARSFAYVSKKNNHNAFDSIGGLRDTFTTRFEPDDLKDLPDWTRANWLGLYNRPYSFRIAAGNARQAEVVLEYDAPDIYPKGVKVQRTLSLAGDQNAVIASSILSPRGVDQPQAYVLETSVPFRSFNQPHYSQWFSRGQSGQEFVPGNKSDLAATTGFFATRNQQTGETFALMLLTPPEKINLVTENHSALLRVTYPGFDEPNRAYSYRVAYYLGQGAPEEIENLFNRLKAQVEKLRQPQAPRKVESYPSP